MTHWRFALVGMVALLLACASAPKAVAPNRSGLPAPRIEDAIGDQDPAIIVVLRPRALLRDRIYGPLLREATERASAQVGFAVVGATALVAFEQSEEVFIAATALPAVAGDGPPDAVVALVGAPADLDPARLVDTDGRPLWGTVGELRPGVLELASQASPDQTALFVLPARTWVIAVGGAVPRARAGLAGAPRSSRVLVPTGEELARLDMPGGLLRREDPRLTGGALAPLGRTLERASVSLLPGAEGVLTVKLAYPVVEDASLAEAKAREVVLAFKRRLEATSKLDWWSWLAAAAVERTDSMVTIRAPLPRPWLEAMARARPVAEGPNPGKSAGSL
jgi:hypothetical protein